MSAMDGWQPKDIVRLVGWGCIALAFVLIFPAVGAGGGDTHEPGADTIRVLLFERTFGIAVLVIALVGVIALLVSLCIRDRS